MAEQYERSSNVPTAEECEDTIELELSAEQRLALSQTHAVTQSPVPDRFPSKVVWKSTQDEPGGWRSIATWLLGASVLSGLMAYVATIPAQSIIVGSNDAVHSVAAATVALPAVERPPVRFTNPFDTTEVFEFPPGTSDAEARQAAADLLLQRARDRQKLWSKVAYQGRKAPVRGASVATKLAQRG